ncbi:MAG: radical SAM protein [Polyangiaceae bacterium]|nr:radical SAM protein [Polyangiaceae bacterium]
METGRIEKQAPLAVALAYPSPYPVAMSSLGFQRIYRALQEAPGVMCERVFLPDDLRDPGPGATTYESGRPLAAHRVVAVSVAYELEVAGLAQLLLLAGVPPLAEERRESHPFVLAGGPLTFSNPLPLSPFVDAVVMGEAEGMIADVCRVIDDAPTKAAARAALAAMPHVFVPELHGSELPDSAKADASLLPAWGPIRTPDTALSGMFLIEAERGCSRRCTYCVMRRSTNGGMRLVPPEVILERVPRDADKVGLVGAAVSDHPKIVELVESFTARGASVGLSSLRPDRLSDAFVGALARNGARALTTAMDGASERLRGTLERKAKETHLVRAAERAKAHGMTRLKLYLMVGLPTETGEDIDECVRFTTELSRILPLSLGIAPFCAKRNTPMDGAGFAGVDVVDDRLDRLRRGLRGRVEVRATSAKWAWVEYVLAQGAAAEGRAVLEAVRDGASFASYKRAFARLPASRERRRLRVVEVEDRPA